MSYITRSNSLYAKNTDSLMNDSSQPYESSNTAHSSLPIYRDPIIKNKSKIKRSKTVNYVDTLKVNKFTESSYKLKLYLNGLVDDETDNKLHDLVTTTLINLDKCLEMNKEIIKNAHFYDYDETLQYNGYRVLTKTFERCCMYTLKSLEKTKTMKHKFPSWSNLIEVFVLFYEIAIYMQKVSLKSLLVDHNDLMFDLIEKFLCLLVTRQKVFYGHTIGFQFCESLKMSLTVVAVALASYNDGYKKFHDNIIGLTAKSLVRGTKYMLNADLRAENMNECLKNCDIDVAKGFLRLANNSILRLGVECTTPMLAVNMLKKVYLEQLKISTSSDPDKLVTVNPPYGSNNKNSKLKIRLLSAEFREGMEYFDLNPTIVNSFQKTMKIVHPKSECLILHAHGGGFMTHSSKTHEVYLKSWCKELHVPIVSIDYSLAPEHPFPKASEECFYVYVWCLLNKDKIGWTGEKIICVGDSAGGNLVTNIVQRAILFDIRIPDDLVPIYTPFLSSFSLSPSKMLSVMDPLINLSILWRCLAGYCGIYTKMNNVNNRKPSLSNSQLELIQKALEDLKVNNEENNSFVNKEEKYDNVNDAKHYFELYGIPLYLMSSLRISLLPTNLYISPLLAEKEVLKQFPPTHLVACEDFLLDDNIEMAKVFRRLGVQHELIVIDNGSTHAFLNMKNICAETKFASSRVLCLLKRIVNNFNK